MEKPLWMIGTTHMFVEIYVLLQVAIIPILVREFQLSILEVSLIATVPNLAALLMSIPAGYLADLFNTNHLLFASMIIEGVSALAISQTTSFWTLVAGATIMRLASPMYHIPGFSHITRLTKHEQLSKSIGFHNALGNLGTAMGLVSLTFFLSTIGWRWTYLFWPFPIMAWGFVLLVSPQLKTRQIKVRENLAGSKSSRLSLLFSPALLVLLAAIAFREIGAAGSNAFMTTYFVDFRNLSAATASLIFGLGPAMGIMGSIGGGYLAEKQGARKALNWIILCCTFLLLAISLASHLYLVALVYLVYSLFTSALFSPMNTIMARITSETERGLSYSLYFLTEGIASSMAPLLAAGLIEWSSVWNIFPFGASLFITSLVMLQFLPRFESKRGSPEKQ